MSVDNFLRVKNKKVLRLVHFQERTHYYNLEIVGWQFWYQKMQLSMSNEKESTTQIYSLHMSSKIQGSYFCNSKPCIMIVCNHAQRGLPILQAHVTPQYWKSKVLINIESFISSFLWIPYYTPRFISRLIGLRNCATQRAASSLLRNVLGKWRMCMKEVKPLYFCFYSC